jgi:phosphoribosyl-ATP pyrophosphohydrolase
MRFGVQCGHFGCFGGFLMSFIYTLDALIESRFNEMPEGSYTTALFKSGLDRILKKIGEEAGEVIISAKNQDLAELKNESADLIFHLLVTLRARGLSFKDVENVLEKRHSDIGK